MLLPDVRSFGEQPVIEYLAKRRFNWIDLFACSIVSHSISEGVLGGVALGLSLAFLSAAMENTLKEK